MRDYARKGGGKQKVSGKKRGSSNDERPFRIIGVVAVIAMLLGVVGSLWFGIALKDGLDRLDKGKQEKAELSAANVSLSAEKEALLQKGKIEAAAGGLGLFPPSEKQMRKP